MGVDPSKRGYLAEINVTPFVDVMLVLLIIFMVTAPLMTQGLEVDLPQTKTVESLPQDTDHMVLTIKDDGSIFLDEYAVPLPELRGYAQRLVKAKNRQLFLRADKNVAYGVVVQVMGELKGAGIDHIGMVADQDQEFTPVAPTNLPADTGADGKATQPTAPANGAAAKETAQ